MFNIELVIQVPPGKRRGDPFPYKKLTSPMQLARILRFEAKKVRGGKLHNGPKHILELSGAPLREQMRRRLRKAFEIEVHLFLMQIVKGELKGSQS